MNRKINIGLSILMLVALALPAMGASATPTLAAASDHFKPSSPTPLGAPSDNLRTPADFEAAAAANPVTTNKILVSRCRFAPFNGNVNFYAALAAGTSDAIVGDTQYSYADGTKCYNPQNESNIVVNPTNSDNVVTSANDYRYDGQHEVYASSDGGATWTNTVLPGWTSATGGTGVFARLGWCGDPAVAFAPDGTLYYSGLVCAGNLVAFFSGVAVAASHDGGFTWDAPHMVNFNNSVSNFNDKEFMTVAPDGTIYVTWTRFLVTPGVGYIASAIVMSKSTDGGSTWSNMAQVSDRSHPYDQGSFPLVAPNGTLYVAYEGATPSSGYMADAIIVARSTDGGVTFSNAEVARAYDDYNCYPINVDGRQTLSGEQFRINSFPSFALDPSNGKLAITWADDQANAGCGYEKGGNFAGSTSNQVKLITSTDGLTWTSPKVITSGAADKVYPAVGANNGRIFVDYYTRAYSPTTNACKAMVQDTATLALSLLPGPVCLDFASKSSGDNFGSETRLTNQSSNPYITFAGSFIGDYNGAVVDSNGTAWGVWADFRGNPGITDPNMDTDVAYGK